MLLKQSYPSPSCSWMQGTIERLKDVKIVVLSVKCMSKCQRGHWAILCSLRSCGIRLYGGKTNLFNM